jgi:predicted metal-binding membrane protein
MSNSETLPRLMLRERVIIQLAVTGVTALSWLYLVELWRAMPDMSAMASIAMPMAPRWTPSAFALTFAMWTVMMIGMMLPSAAPMILTFAALSRRKERAVERMMPVLLFASGYLLVWTAFSLIATLLQWALDRLGLLSPMLTTTNALIGGALFLMAGVYQLTPLKEACLRHCRSPFAFLFNRWRDGLNGALGMGLEHGAYCLGCCWLLMTLLFVVGVMNLLWVAAITLFVLAEKLLRGGAWIARISGVVMAGYGIWLVVQV